VLLLRVEEPNCSRVARVQLGQGIPGVIRTHGRRGSIKGSGPTTGRRSTIADMSGHKLRVALMTASDESRMTQWY